MSKPKKRRNSAQQSTKPVQPAKQGKAQIGDWAKRAKAALEKLPQVEALLTESNNKLQRALRINQQQTSQLDTQRANIQDLQENNAFLNRQVTGFAEAVELANGRIKGAELELKAEKRASEALKVDRDEWRRKALEAQQNPKGFWRTLFSQ